MVVLRDVDIDFSAGLHRCRGKLDGFVVALGAPGDIVGIAKCVDVENVDVGRSQKEVLDEACQQVPRVKEEDGNDDPEDIGRNEGEDDIPEERVLEQFDDVEAMCLGFNLD